jgi:hypothetical protein
VAASTFPTAPGNPLAHAIQVVTADGHVLAVFRMVETAGYSLHDGQPAG